MPETRFLQHGGAAIYIETDSAGGGEAALGPKFVRALQTLAAAIGSGMHEMAGERPSELDVSFRLGVNDNGHFVIARQESAANFTISMRWSGGRPALEFPVPLEE